MAQWSWTTSGVPLKYPRLTISPHSLQVGSECPAAMSASVCRVMLVLARVPVLAQGSGTFLCRRPLSACRRSHCRGQVFNPLRVLNRLRRVRVIRATNAERTMTAIRVMVVIAWCVRW